MRIVVLAAALLALAGCGSGATKEQAEFVCVNLDAANRQGQGLVQPYGFTIEQLEKKYEVSPGDAADWIDEAVDDTCPELRVLVPRS